jgi:hypothetical protein
MTHGKSRRDFKVFYAEEFIAAISAKRYAELKIAVAADAKGRVACAQIREHTPFQVFPAGLSGLTDQQGRAI